MARPTLVALAILSLAAPAAGGTLAAQDFTGTYRLATATGTTITLTLQQSRTGQITGTLQGNTAFQVQAQVANGQFSGYAANQSGRLYLEGRIQGAQLQVAMAEVGPDGQPQVQTAQSVTMERVGGAGQAGALAPGKMGAPMGQMGAPMGQMAGPGQAMAPGGGSPQDQQITQLLLRSAWCSFSYSSAGGASGRSSTERVVFQADGSGVQQTGGESYYSGSAGSVAGQASGGQPFRWQVRGGVLQLSADGVTWQPQPLQITTNSSGYPIINAGGTEYSMCN